MRKSQSFSGSIRANDQEGRDEENENGVSTRCNRAGDTAWAPRSSAGRTAGSAGPRRRNAQLRWAVRGQDPLKEQRVPRGTSGGLGDRTRVELPISSPASS